MTNVLPASVPLSEACRPIGGPSSLFIVFHCTQTINNVVNMDPVDKLTNTILNYERFIEVEDYETRQSVNDLKNPNSKRMTDCHVRLFTTWLVTWYYYYYY